MAKVPEYLKGFNGITYLLENPCDDPWTIYLEFAFPALGDAIISILTFGFDDVMRGYFRPTKGLRTVRHRRRGRKGGRPKGGIPEIGEMIGEKLPGRETFKTRTVSQGVKYLWIVDGIIQRGLWYWLVFDILNTFFYDWASAIFESNAGEDCAPSRLLAYGASDASHALFGWNAPFLTFVPYEEGLVWNTIQVFLPAGKRFTVVFGLDATSGPGQGFDAQVGLFTDGTFTTSIEIGDMGFVAPETTSGFVVSADLEGPVNVVIGFRNLFGLALLSNMWCSVIETV